MSSMVSSRVSTSIAIVVYGWGLCLEAVSKGTCESLGPCLLSAEADCEKTRSDSAEDMFSAPTHRDPVRSRLYP
jgi:hypothetical protein